MKFCAYCNLEWSYCRCLDEVEDKLRYKHRQVYEIDSNEELLTQVQRIDRLIKEIKLKYGKGAIVGHD